MMISNKKKERARILPLLLSLCMLLDTGSLFAAPAANTGEEESLFSDMPIVMGISKKGERVNESPVATYVISRDELKRWGVRQMSEIFARVPGYSFYDFDFMGDRTPPVRGLYGVYRSVLSYELLPVFDWSWAVLAPNFVKSIEVARGASGVAWGSRAESGVANINLRDDLEGAESSVEHGQFRRSAYSFAYGHHFKDANPGDNMFVGLYKEQQGYKKFSASAIYPTDPQSTWKTSGLDNDTMSLLAKMQYDKIKFLFYKDILAAAERFPLSDKPGALEAQVALRTDPYQRMESMGYRFEYSLFKSDMFDLSAYHQLSDKFFWVELVYQSRQNQEDSGISGNVRHLLGDRLDINFGGDLVSNQKTNAPGWQSSWVRAAPYNLSIRDNGTFNGQKAATTLFHQRNFYVQGNYAFNDKWKMTLGGRMDHQEKALPTRTIFSGPQASLIYLPTRNFTTKYTFKRSARLPTGNEVVAGNGPEFLTSHEVSAIYDVSNKVNLDVTLVEQQLHNALLPNPATGISYVNADGGLRTRGVEWGTKYYPVKPWLLYCNGSVYDFHVITDPNGKNIPMNTNQLPLFVPKFSSFIGTEVGFFDSAVFLNAALRSNMGIPYQDLSGNYLKRDVSFVDLTARTKKFWDRVSCSLSALNALNQHKGVPLFGQQTIIGSNKNVMPAGLLPPMQRRIIAEVTVNF